MQKILIVEDDGDIAAIERDYLELNNYQVEIAADGLAGLERGLHGDFDLILLDLMLPGMDGFSVCRRLREETDIPILMVTARREDIDKIRGLGLGADDYIEKPFSPSVLVARVRAHLARYERLTGGQQRAKPELQVGGVRLNWEAAYGKSYKIQVSNDAKSWTEVYKTDEGREGINEVFFPKEVKARYVRMLGIELGWWYGYSLWSMDVLGGTKPSEGLSDVHFLRLTLKDKDGKVISTNSYWRGNERTNFNALEQLPGVKLDVYSKLTRNANG